MVTNLRIFPIHGSSIRKEKKNYARTMYWHDCEPVVRMLNTAGRVVAWGVMPLGSSITRNCDVRSTNASTDKHAQLKRIHVIFRLDISRRLIL